jgi:hypothetical protein
MVTAELDAAGGVVVETRTAPPALLVRPDGVQLLPAAPGLRLPAQMRTGDRLLLCSAAVLDSPPVGLVEILKAPAQKVLSMSPDELLRILLDGDHAGAAAVVIRAPLDPDIRSIDEGGRA